MSVYVGIDVHRKRSQVAVVDQSGEVLTNRSGRTIGVLRRRRGVVEERQDALKLGVLTSDDEGGGTRLAVGPASLRR